MRTLATIAALLLSAASQAGNVCDRTPEVRDAIMDAVDAEDCWYVRLASVYRLPIVEKGLTALQADDFDGLTGLAGLELRGNQLTSLPEGLFDGLYSLQSLSLSSNQLTALPEGVFDDLDLEHLGLDYNQLTSLPEGCSMGCPACNRCG